MQKTGLDFAKKGLLRKNIESEIADIVTSKWDLFYIERKNPTLENIFLQYIKDKK